MHILIVLCAMVVGFILAADLAEKLKNQYPDAKPYMWGYFTGIAGLIAWGGHSVWAFYEAIDGPSYKSDDYIILGVIMLFIACSHILVIKRNKWGWVIAIITQFNPITWIINGIYLKNRWHELAGFPESHKQFQSWFFQLSRGIRFLICGSVFWIFSVVAFVFVFEPFGYTINGREWEIIIKAIIVPPIIACIGAGMYKMAISKQSD